MISMALRACCCRLVDIPSRHARSVDPVGATTALTIHTVIITKTSSASLAAINTLTRPVLFQNEQCSSLMIIRTAAVPGGLNHTGDPRRDGADDFLTR